TRGPPDACAHAQIALRPQHRSHRAQTVVPALSPAELGLDDVEGQVHVIVDGDDPLGGDAVEVGQLPDRTARLVHVSCRGSEHHPRAGQSRNAAGGQSAGADVRPQLRPGQRGPDPRSEFGDDQLPDVVTGRFVLRSGIAQAEDQPCLVRHCRPLLLYDSCAARLRPPAGRVPVLVRLPAGREYRYWGPRRFRWAASPTTHRNPYSVCARHSRFAVTKWDHSSSEASSSPDFSSDAASSVAASAVSSSASDSRSISISSETLTMSSSSSATSSTPAGSSTCPASRCSPAGRP